MEAETRLTAEHITLALIRYFDQLGYDVLTEFTLKSGRRVDIIAAGPKEELVIIEVKSSLADFQSDQKWPDYLEWADQFYFAVSDDFPSARLPNADKCGVLITDGYDVFMQREAPLKKLASQRRLHLMKRLAHTAMRRLTLQKLQGI